MEKAKRKRLIKNPESMINQKTNEDFNKADPAQDNFDADSNLNRNAEDLKKNTNSIHINTSCDIKDSGK